MRYAGLFYVRQPQALLGALDAPYAVMGRHALCAKDWAGDGGAMACAAGRLLNAKELRAALSVAGVRVDEAGGAAALALGAYRLWGDQYPRHLQGPVATAVIDQDAGMMVVSRDRMGEQPVFYASRGGSVAFANHPETLLAVPFVARATDADGLRELFALGPARTPGRTPFRDIHALEPGGCLVADGRGAHCCRYYRMDAQPHEDDEKTTIDRVRALVEQAFHEVCPLNPASMLSGGLDSSVLTALLARDNGPARTWSVEYEEDESYFVQNDYQHERDNPYIQEAIQLLGARHHVVRVGQEALADALHDAMLARGMPGMADIDSSLMLFAQQIAPGAQYILSGECADEVFGGYPWFHRAELIAADGFPWSGSLALREKVLRPAVREELQLSHYEAARFHEAAARQPRLSGEAPEAARLRLLHGLCLQWFMPCLQERASCMCGASGLTVLTPYADERLAEYVYNVPWTIKNLNGQVKGLLRAAMRDLLPDHLLNRRKSPYPKTHHPAYSKRVCAQMESVLSDPHAPLNELVDAEALRTLMDSGLRASDTPWYGQLMTGPQMIAYLLQVNDWMQTYRIEIVL